MGSVLPTLIHSGAADVTRAVAEVISVVVVVEGSGSFGSGLPYDPDLPCFFLKVPLPPLPALCILGDGLGDDHGEPRGESRASSMMAFDDPLLD